MKTRLLILTTAGLIGLVGCSRSGGQASVTPPDEEAAAGPTNRIPIPAMVRNNLGITFTAVERRWVNGTIRVPGAFELQPRARHEYRMTLPGRVDLIVDQYQRVESGDVLYRFSSPQWPELQYEIILGEQAIDSAHAEIEVAAARITEAQRRIALMKERLAALAEADFKQAGLESEAAELEASLPRLRAERHLAETKLANARRTREHALHRASAASGIPEQRLAAEVEHDDATIPAYRTIDWIDVRATEPGVVETLAVTDGAFVEPPAIVVSIVDPAKVRFRAMALQADITKLLGSTEARIAPPTSPDIPLGDAIPASVTIGLEAHPEQRTVTLLATPEALRPWIRPGVSAFLEVVVESTGGPALAIPRAAIVKEGIVHVFFRRDPSDPNKAIRVEADMGVSDGRWVAINSGLSLQDEVVLDGVYELKLAGQQNGGAGKGGHFHADGTFHGDN